MAREDDVLSLVTDRSTADAVRALQDVWDGLLGHLGESPTRALFAVRARAAGPNLPLVVSPDGPMVHRTEGDPEAGQRALDAFARGLDDVLRLALPDLSVTRLVAAPERMSLPPEAARAVANITQLPAQGLSSDEIADALTDALHPLIQLGALVLLCPPSPGERVHVVAGDATPEPTELPELSRALLNEELEDLGARNARVRPELDGPGTLLCAVPASAARAQPAAVVMLLGAPREGVDPRPIPWIAGLAAQAAASAVMSDRLRRAQQQSAEFDPVTRVAATRQRFIDEVQRQADVAARYERPFSIVIVDVDRLGRINDTFGRDVGDRVLREVANAMTTAVRAVDLVARLHREDFGIVLPETNAEGAHPCAERIRLLIGKLRLSLPEGDLLVEASLGYTAWHPGDTALSVRLRAERAVKRAKEEGRNRVVSA